MNKQPEVTQATRKKIIDAFERLYLDNRIEKVTVSAITKEAHIHRSTFYEYFSDVYNLLEEYEKELLDYVENEYARQCLTKETFNLETIVPIAIKVYGKCIEPIHHLLGPSGDPAFQDKLLQRMKPYYFNVSEADPNDPYFELKFTLVFNTIFSMMNYWCDHKDTFTFEEMIRFIQPLVLMYKKIINGVN